MNRRWTGIHLLAFAFLLTFLSGFGQTFFIGLFGDDLRDAAGLDHGTFGTLYAIATLISAISLFWAGAWIDRIRLGHYLAGVTVLFVIGCLLMGWIKNALVLGLAIFLLRFSGQGLFSHIAMTTTARLFTAARGRALSVAFLGHPAGEAVLPPLVILVTAAHPWQSVWVGAAAALAMILPLLLYLGRPAVAAFHEPKHTSDPADTEPGGLTRRDVMRDRTFHLLLPSLLTPGFVATGIFIHQSALTAEKGWTPAWFALNFSAFAAAQVIGNLTAGQLVDRFTARRLMPLYLLPLAASTALSGPIQHPLAATLLMAGSGLSNGSSAAITNAMWAETYGVRHIGAIRAMASSILVVSTALSPALFGYLLEGGTTFGLILVGCGVWSAGAALLAGGAMRASA